MQNFTGSITVGGLGKLPVLRMKVSFFISSSNPQVALWTHPQSPRKIAYIIHSLLFFNEISCRIMNFIDTCYNYYNYREAFH